MNSRKVEETVKRVRKCADRARISMNMKAVSRTAKRVRLLCKSEQVHQRKECLPCGSRGQQFNEETAVQPETEKEAAESLDGLTTIPRLRVRRRPDTKERRERTRNRRRKLRKRLAEGRRDPQEEMTEMGTCRFLR